MRPARPGLPRAAPARARDTPRREVRAAAQARGLLPRQGLGRRSSRWLLAAPRCRVARRFEQWGPESGRQEYRWSRSRRCGASSATASQTLPTAAAITLPLRSASPSLRRVETPGVMSALRPGSDRQREEEPRPRRRTQGSALSRSESGSGGRAHRWKRVRPEAAPPGPAHRAGKGRGAWRGRRCGPEGRHDSGLRPQAGRGPRTDRSARCFLGLLGVCPRSSQPGDECGRGYYFTWLQVVSGAQLEKLVRCCRCCRGHTRLHEGCLPPGADLPPAIPEPNSWLDSERLTRTVCLMCLAFVFGVKMEPNRRKNDD